MSSPDPTPTDAASADPTDEVSPASSSTPSPTAKEPPPPARNLADACDRLVALARETRSGKPDEDSSPLVEWARLIELGEDRRASDPDAPLLTVLLGPTGAGKSTIFNQLLGREVSRPGAIRPFTSRPLAIGSARAVEFFRADPFLSEADLDLEWVIDDDLPAPLDRQLLVDTPDFDSIESENRRRAERLLYRADRIFVVLTPEKYGDATVWEIVDRLRPLASLNGAVFNKAEGDGPREDCARLLAERGLAAPIVIPRRADPDDERALEAAPREALDELLSMRTSARDLLRERREALLEAETLLRESSIEPWVFELDRAVDELRGRIEERRRTLGREIERRLAFEIDAALKRELESRFLEEVQRIDILREPRRWLSAPFTWVKGLWSSDDKPNERAPESTAEWLTGLYFERYQEFAYRLADELREDVTRARSVAPTLGGFAWIETPNPSDAALRTTLSDVFRGLEKDLVEESERIAKGLPMSGKIGFYGSQVIFHSLVSVACLKTGGLLSPAELAAQGLVSPFVARVVGQFVSSSEASQVEERLGRSFTERLEEATAEVFRPLEQQIAAVRSAVPTRDDWNRLVREWQHALRKGSA